MKTAYLIIAHDNFQVLKYLIESLDDYRNDIYLHIDQKVDELPSFQVKNSNLIILEQRVDVRWGTTSQIECEYLLFEKSFYSGVDYVRYNLISGTHYPLKSNDEIHDFFEKLGNVQLMSFMYTNDYEINFKLGYYHFLLSKFGNRNKVLRFSSKLIWQILIKVQKLLKIKRVLLPIDFKASNWVSLTSDAVSYVLLKKEHVIQRFRLTLCGDEFFIPYLLTNSSTGFTIKDEPLLLYTDFGDGSNPRFLEYTDVDFLVKSDYLFARKFSNVNVILEILAKRQNLESN